MEDNITDGIHNQETQDEEYDGRREDKEKVWSEENNAEWTRLKLQDQEMIRANFDNIQDDI